MAKKLKDIDRDGFPKKLVRILESFNQEYINPARNEYMNGVFLRDASSEKSRKDSLPQRKKSEESWYLSVWLRLHPPAGILKSFPAQYHGLRVQYEFVGEIDSK